MKKLFFAVLCLLLGAMFVAQPARADGLHLLYMDDGRLVQWQGGCTASVWVEPDALAQYGTAITRARAILARVTGIQLTDAPNSESANLRYALTQFDGVDEGRFGEYDDTSKTVLLRDNAPVLAVDPALADNLRFNLVLHETMHWLGLGHDDELGRPNEMMGIIITNLPFTGFGEGDKTGLAYISILNGCTPLIPRRVAKPADYIRLN